MNPYSIITKLVNRGRSLALALSVVSATSLFTVSCQDFFDVNSNMVIDASKDHLSSARDSIYSVIGILNKLQAIADRTVLLGEARGDLVDITSTTSKDLREVALFNISDDNKYNSPREYYDVINNCNYFINHVDTAMTNNRNEHVYLNEYAVVKAIRAWTYLQLVTTYGKVPFVTDPILTKEEGEKDYPQYDITQVCDYFINNDGLQQLADNENITYPHYGDIKSTPSRLFFIPLNLILGDLYLWRASINNNQSDYLSAAKCYYNDIRKRNGTSTSSAYPTSEGCERWIDDTWNIRSSSWSYMLREENNAAQSEVITIIPMDSIKSEGYYSEIRSIFCTSFNDDQTVGLVPSEAIKELSADQSYCLYDKNSSKFIIAPKGLDEDTDGDLRLSSVWDRNENSINKKGERYTSQTIGKFLTKNCNINIYRRGQVYLRFAEAMNHAGFPRYAYQILASGVNNDVINYCINPFIDSADSTTVSQFAFSTSTYEVGAWRSETGSYRYVYTSDGTPMGNHIGIHSRGSGISAFNDDYRMPHGEAVMDTIIVFDEKGEPIGYKFNVHKDKETPGKVEAQIKAVDEMIINEQALETAFEGYRFYDLVRAAYRNYKDNPDFLANKIKGRAGKSGSTAISADLRDTKNWFLKWNKQIGLY